MFFYLDRTKTYAAHQLKTSRDRMPSSVGC